MSNMAACWAHLAFLHYFFYPHSYPFRTQVPMIGWSGTEGHSFLCFADCLPFSTTVVPLHNVKAAKICSLFTARLAQVPLQQTHLKNISKFLFFWEKLLVNMKSTVLWATLLYSYNCYVTIHYIQKGISIILRTDWIISQKRFRWMVTFPPFPL
jgi:hypothetical protein